MCGVRGGDDAEDIHVEERLGLGDGGFLYAAELPTPLDRPAGSENDKASTGKAFGGGVANPQDAPVTMTVPDFSAGCCCLIGFY